MDMDHPNAVVYKKTAELFRSGDRKALQELIDEEVVWHVPGDHQMAGDIRGRTALFEWFGKLGDLGFRLSEHDVFASDEHVCALSIMSAERPGLRAETRVVSIFHYRNGRQLERWFYPEDRSEWNRIFGAP